MKDGSVARQIKNICILVMEMRYLKDDKYRNIGGMSSDILHTHTLHSSTQHHRSRGRFTDICFDGDKELVRKRKR